MQRVILTVLHPLLMEDLCNLENYFDISSVYFFVKCNISIFYGLINFLHGHSVMNGNTTRINK